MTSTAHSNFSDNPYSAFVERVEKSLGHPIHDPGPWNDELISSTIDLGTSIAEGGVDVELLAKEVSELARPVLESYVVGLSQDDRESIKAAAMVGRAAVMSRFDSPTPLPTPPAVLEAWVKGSEAAVHIFAANIAFNTPRLTLLTD